MLSIEEGRRLISFIRSSLQRKIRGLPLATSDSVLSKYRAGLFITVEYLVRSGGWERREVRGSLGVVEPVKDLAHDAARISAKLAASIPRFSEMDLKRSVVEATIIKDIRPARIEELTSLRWGVEGVYVPPNFAVLPQTMLERKLLGDVLQRYVVSSVGVPDRLYVFSTQIFYELRPEGDVIERELWRSRIISQALGLNSGA
ncbi:MAG: AMMECR1 domain-containing protein [Thermoproteus sp. AZ2]|jgi:AMMECR1 domain-containing protein|uniref:AMMECR1 domain-containing protein n=1 Tax=Thermoproteus sp. AZ2 TaxID=1609232 RepID=A0ACC6V3A8_9CREN